MINCVAIDDEPIALSILQQYCSRRGDMRLVCFSSPEEGMEHILETCPDLVFLDIEMNSHNGLDLARRLPEGTTLVLTTAYPQYALEGFNVNAVDFLHKPIFYPRFEQAVEKARTWMGHRETKASSRDSVILKSEHKNVVVSLDSISYIEAMDNYVKVCREGLPTVISQMTMKELENLLPADRFLRVHRSFIVSLDSIDRFSNRKIHLTGVANPIPVGRTYNSAFLRAFADK